MSDLVQLILAIGTLGAFVTALGTIIVSWRNARASDRAAEIAALAADRAEEAKRMAAEQAEHSKRELLVIGDKIVEIGNAVDGRLSKLLDAETRAAHAEGRAEGIAEEQARTAKVLENLAAGVPVTGAEALSGVHPALPQPIPVSLPLPIEVKVIQDDADPAVRVTSDPK